MNATETTKPRTCRRCKGSGEYSWGRCYGCQGRGVIVPESTVSDPEADAEYQATLDARAARAAAREARRGSR